MSNAIPSAARAAVRGRERQHCVRCGMKGAEIHHRRSKSVRDEHTHCPCNLVYLCGWGNHTGCHGWAHSNPFAAKQVGLVVARSVAQPGLVLVQYALEGPMLLTCDGFKMRQELIPPAEDTFTVPMDLRPIEPI